MSKFAIISWKESEGFDSANFIMENNKIKIFKSHKEVYFYAFMSCHYFKVVDFDYYFSGKKA